MSVRKEEILKQWLLWVWYLSMEWSLVLREQATVSMNGLVDALFNV